MSRQTYEQAIAQVLSAEMNARPEMLLLQAGAYPVLAGDEREIFLPRVREESAVNLAVGAALAGAYPVLDMRLIAPEALPGALNELSIGVHPAMTIIAGLEEEPLLRVQLGLRCFAPRNPRQAAGFLRAALRSGNMCALLADESLTDMEDEVPDDDDFMLVPLDDVAEEEVPDDALEADPFVQLMKSSREVSHTLPDWFFAGRQDDAEEMEEAAEYGDDAEPVMDDASYAGPEMPAAEREYSAEEEEITADDEYVAGAAEPLATPVPEVSRLAARSIPFDGSALKTLEEQLAAPRGVLIRLLMERLRETEASFEWRCEYDVLPGECAFLPPERESALMWVGADQITLTYDVKKLFQGRAALLIRAARRLMEKPTLLIYDRERDRV